MSFLRKSLPDPLPVPPAAEPPPVVTPPPETGRLNPLTERAVTLCRDIVDVSGFLDGVGAAAQSQGITLQDAGSAAAQMQEASDAMIAATGRLTQSIGGMVGAVGETARQLGEVMGSSQRVFGWVSGLETKLDQIDGAVEQATASNGRILHIAREVNILAINAKIEAARAGASGRGFAVVADAINELSTQTAQAAAVISDTVTALAREVSALRAEATQIAASAREGLGALGAAEGAISDLSARAAEGGEVVTAISGDAERMNAAVAGFAPRFDELRSSVKTQSAAAVEARERVVGLIELSESMVQKLVELGGATSDQPLIEAVMARAAALGSALSQAVAGGQIRVDALFSQDYRPIAGSNPPQVMAPFTSLTDRLFPPVQEEALALDKRIVFCAAVDRNGYLPTHNRKFSQPQGGDPVWNAANCRNRRMFNDRVGLAAGRNMAPFLLQVYRRDMGGGKFLMMKDVSAPILVNGRHWGGLRLAYAF